MNRQIHRFFIGILFSCLSLATFLLGDSPEYIPIEDKANLPILTPSLAKAKTSKIKLSNGLEAYLISDPDADQSAAALTVKIGSWDDPDVYPGLAHFLEHMLFLGTKKYPKESEYDRFIKEHGGSANAFTSNDFTSYLFAINNDAFEDALDRFSYFFKDPLFNPSGVSRELHAIDQEYAQNVEKDDVRMIYVLKQLANENHPYHRFNIGNTTTLSSVSQEILKEWYQQHYSANLMRLVIVSPLPLEKLKEIVVKDFKGVPNHQSKPTDSILPVFSKDTSGQMIYIEPVKDIRSLTLIWDLPPAFAHMLESKPEALACYILGHEGKESLLAELKREGLAESLACGSSLIGPNNREFYLDVDLTDLGIHKVNTVIERIFQALAKFRQTGIPQYIFDEAERMDKIEYQYQPRQSAFENVLQYAMSLPYEEMPTYPLYSQVIQKFDRTASQNLLNFLTPEHCRFALMASPTVTGIKEMKKEPWMGVEYAIKPIPPETLKEWSQAASHPNINLPAPNPYIPEHLSLVQGVASEQTTSIIPKMKLIQENAQSKIFFSEDNQFQQPKIQWIFEIKTPQITIGDAESVVLGDLFVKHLTESLSWTSYPATLASLNFTIERKENGLSISIEGYSEKAPLLMTEILKSLHIALSEQNFKIYKTSLLRQYQNFYKGTPLAQASELMKSLIYKNYTTEKEKAAALRKISYDKYNEFAEHLFEKNYVQGILFGNMTEKKAKQVAESISTLLGGEPYPYKDHLAIEAIVLPEGEGPFFIENKTSVQGSATLLAIESPSFSFQKRAAQQILMQAISEPFFGQLRTRQQTGYIVFSSGEDIEKELFNLFAVQSNTHDPRDLLARFESFIEGYMQEIESELPEDRFLTIKNALISIVSHPAKNIKEMGELLNKIAFKYDADFDWINKRIEGFHQLKYSDFLDFSKQFLGSKNKRRAALLIKGKLPDDRFSYRKIPNVLQLRTLSTFRSDGT
jgi:insulysin